MFKKLLLLTVIVAFNGCFRDKPSVHQEPLFSISLGVMEDELNLFQSSGAIFPKQVHFTANNGFIFVADPVSSKVMKFSGHGDILQLNYNEKSNPPFSLHNEKKHIFPWNFKDINTIAVDGKNYLYVDDRTTEEQLFSTGQNNVLEDRIVLRFDDKGQYLDFIGQKGRNAGQFPFINNIYTNQHNDLIVICRRLDTWQIFWFTEEGELKYSPYTLKNEDFSLEKANYTIDSIKIDPEEPYIYVQASNAEEDGDSAKQDKKNNILEQKPAETYLYIQSIDQSKPFKSSFQLPVLNHDVFTFLGADTNKNLYLISPSVDDHNQYELSVTDYTGQPSHQFRLTAIMDYPFITSSFNLSPEGILTNMLLHNQGAEISWWRIDKLINFENKAALHDR